MSEEINPFLKKVKDSAMVLMEDCLEDHENCLLFVSVSDDRSATGMAGNTDDLSDALAAAMLEKPELVELVQMASFKYLEMRVEQRVDKLKQERDSSKQN